MPYSPANPFDLLFSGGNRSYNKFLDKQQVFTYGFNPAYDNGNSLTGQWQPFTMDNAGALRVNIGTGISISASVTGVNVTVPSSTAVTGVVAVTGGVTILNPSLPVQVVNAIAVTGQLASDIGTVTGQLSALQISVNLLTGMVRWQKTKTAGYVTGSTAVANSCLLNKVMGYSNTAQAQAFVQVFDSATIPATGSTPDFSTNVQPGQNWFIDLAENGVVFSNGVTVVQSSSPIQYVPYAAADFTVSTIYKT